MNQLYTTLKTVLIAIILLVGVSVVFIESTETAYAQTDVKSMVNPTNEVILPGSEGGGIASLILGWVLRPFAWAFQLFGTLFMAFGSTFLASAIEMSIGPALNAIPGIQVGWEVMRDFANLFFIFVILYIAIKTILQLGNHDTKTMLVRVIVVALLINFSGFFTRVVIDAGNVLAVGFYDTIITSPAPNPDPTNPTSSACSTGNCTIGDRFASILDVASFAEGPEGGEVGLNDLQISLMYFLNGAIFFVLGMVFLKGAFYFIARMIAFVFLIMFSPIAFLAYAVPNSSASSFLGGWWSKLIGYSMLAPAYLIIIYLVLQVATGVANTGGFDFMNYVIIIGLIKLGSDQAFKLADSTGTKMADWGGKIAGQAAGVGVGAVTGAAAYTGRQSFGRLGNAMANGEALNAQIARGGVMGKFAELRKEQYNKVAKSSFDVAQSGLGGSAIGYLGATVPKGMQKEGGFKKSGRVEHHVFNRGKLTKEQEADKVAHAKELFPDDPIKQRDWLKKEMGSDWKSGAWYKPESWTKGDANYDTTKNKDAKEIKGKAASEVFKKAEVKRLEDHINDLETSGTWTKADDKDLQDAIEKNNVTETTLLQAKLDTAMSAAGKTAGKTVGDEMKDAMKKLGSRFVSELNESTLGSNLVAAHLTSNDLKQMHRNDMDGKFSDKTLIDRVGKNVFGGGKNPKGTEYLASPEGRKELMNYGLERKQVMKTKVYAKNARLRKKLRREVEDIKLDISTYPPGTTPKEIADNKEAVQKLQDRLEKKEEELEKKEENTRIMLS